MAGPNETEDTSKAAQPEFPNLMQDLVHNVARLVLDAKEECSHELTFVRLMYSTRWDGLSPPS
jgi:hypothetical protein